MPSLSKYTAKSEAIRFIFFLLLILFGLLAVKFIQADGSADTAAPTEQLELNLDAKNSVKLSMHRLETKQSEPTPLAPSIRVRWQAGQTVLEATRLAGDKSKAWQSRWQGEAEMALLTELSGLANEGADGLNWQFDLNGNYAKRGAGQTTLEPGDEVLWRLMPYE